MAKKGTPDITTHETRNAYEYLRKHFTFNPSELTKGKLNNLIDDRIQDLKKHDAIRALSKRKRKEMGFLRMIRNKMGIHNENQNNIDIMLTERHFYKLVKTRRGKKTFTYAKRIKMKGETIKWKAEEEHYFIHLEKMSDASKAELLGQKFNRHFTVKALHMKRHRLKKRGLL